MSRRILLLNHNRAWRGGTFVRAWQIGRRLARRGHDVTLIAISPSARVSFRQETVDGVRVVESPDFFWGAARTGWDPWDAARRSLMTARGRWDVVHAFDSRPVVIAPALVARRRGAALVMDWADWWGRGGTIEERAPGAGLKTLIRPVETFFEEAFRTHADATTVISSALRDRAAGLGVPPDTILVLPQGSDVEGIVPRAREACREAVTIPSAETLFGYLGTLTRSDADLLWRAMRAARARMPAARFVLIGNPGVAVPRDLDAIETGFVDRDRLLVWLGACDVLLLPLRDTLASRARWPSKANDYLAAGRPVAATRVGDLAPMIDAAGAGIVTDPTPDALAAAMLALGTDRDRWIHRCEAARALATGRLAWDTVVDAAERHYAAAIAARLRRSP